MDDRSVTSLTGREMPTLGHDQGGRLGRPARYLTRRRSPGCGAALRVP
jgi:hypothetical protein